MTTPGPTTPSMGDNLAAALDLMLGRSGAITRFDLTADGLWRSFTGLLLAGCIDCAALIMAHRARLNINADYAWSQFGFITMSLLIALVAYCVSLLALWLLCRDPAHAARFPVALIAHNWAAPVVSLAFLPLIVLSHSMSGTFQAIGLIAMISAIAGLVIVGTRLIRLTLQLTSGMAFGWFLLTSFVSLVVNEGLQNLLRL